MGFSSLGANAGPGRLRRSPQRILDSVIGRRYTMSDFVLVMPSRDRSSATDLTPLSPAVFHILLSLGEGERHGYALKREIVLRTRGKLKLGPGMLYGSINKMLELGLIEESDARPDPHLDDARRRYYRITDYGRKVAQAEAARMRELVQLAA